MNQPRTRRLLNDIRTIQFGRVEITQRRWSDINHIADNTIPAGIATKNPGHITRPGRDSLGNLHEHGIYPARAIKDPQGVRDPTPVQGDIGPQRTVWG